MNFKLRIKNFLFFSSLNIINLKNIKEEICFFVYKIWLKLNYKLSKLYQSTSANFGKQLLLWDMGGLSTITHIQGTLGFELRKFNYKSKQIICDGLPLACIQREVDIEPSMENWEKSCNSCKRANHLRAIRWGNTPIFPREIISTQIIEELTKKTESLTLEQWDSILHRNVKIKDMVNASVIRFFKGERNSINDIIKDEYGKEVLRKYIFASLVGIELAHKLIEDSKTNAILVSHGVYVDYAPIVEIAKFHSIPTAAWYSGHNRGSIYIVDPAHWARSDNRKNRKGLSLNSRTQLQIKSRRLNRFLENRYNSSEMSDIYVKNTSSEVGTAISKIKQEGNYSRVATLFPHLSWDFAAGVLPEGFKSHDDWILSCVQEMCNEKQILWLVKVHPAEHIFGTRLSTELLISRTFGELPQNIKIIPSNSNISTDRIHEMTDFGITLGGTSALELSARGKLCLVSSAAYFAGYGFTPDASNSKEFQKNLRNLPIIPKMSEDQKNLAVQFAYKHFIEDPVLINWLHSSSLKAQDKYKLPPKINFLSDPKNRLHTRKIAKYLERDM